MRENERKWSYFSTILREFKLTRNQLKLAMEKGLVRYKQIPNPHYSTASPAILIYREDVEANIEKIRKFPKYSEEERKKRRIYAKRSRLRRKVGFYCPRCKKHIRIRRDSELFEAYWDGYVSEEV